MVTKLQKGDKAPAATVVNVAEERVALSSSWADGPIFLTFLRHFG